MCMTVATSMLNLESFKIPLLVADHLCEPPGAGLEFTAGGGITVGQNLDLLDIPCDHLG